MKGQHVAEEQFSVALPSVLSLHFASPEPIETTKRKKSSIPSKRGWERLGTDKPVDQDIDERQEHEMGLQFNCFIVPDEYFLP